MLGRETVRLASQLLGDPAEAANALLTAQRSQFSADGVEALVSLLGPAWSKPDGRPAIQRTLGNHATPAAIFVAARLAQQDGLRQEALTLFEQLSAQLPEPDATLLLHRARLLADLDRNAEASQCLRECLGLNPPYTLTVKAEKLVKRLMVSPENAPRRRLKLAVLGSSTTALLAGPLAAACFRDGIALELYQAPYGSIFQEIHDPASGLYRFGPDVTMVLVNHRDLALPANGGLSQARAFVENLRHGWAALQGRHPCHIIQFLFDHPGEGGWGTLEDQLPEGRRRVVAAANHLLADELPPAVTVIDPERAARMAGGQFVSEEEWARNKQYPATAALPALADVVVAQCRAVLGLSAKVLVLDLDNTVWGGVIGEDGLNGIVIGPPDPNGEAYLALQRHALELKSRGVLLAACTKNNLADAEAPFRHHDAMLLKLEDFVAFRANWEDKASNIQAIAQELRLGLDSFIFLDDNPIERAWVRERLPAVTVPECGSDPCRMLASLQRGLYFETVALTAEDVARNASYRATAELAGASGAGGVEDFLVNLGMVAEHGPVDELTLARATQLVNKTNQFNLTTTRYTEAEVRAIANSPDWWCRWFRLSDRFGDHGLIGLIFARRDAGEWVVDTWLMSCRVLGRRVEDFMLDCLLRAAIADGARSVRARYLPTAKNAPVADLLPRLGFAGTDVEGEALWMLEGSALPDCRFIAKKDSDG